MPSASMSRSGPVRPAELRASRPRRGLRAGPVRGGRYREGIMERVASPVEFTEDELARGPLRGRRPGARPSSRTPATVTVLMLGYMDGEALRRTLQTGQVLVLEPQPAASTGARARPRATASGCGPSATTATATPCWWSWTRTGTGPATPGRGRASTDPSAPTTPSGAAGGPPAHGVSAAGSTPDRPGRDVFAELCRRPPHRPGVARARGRHPHPGGRLPARRGRAAPGSSSSRSRAASAGAGTRSWAATRSATLVGRGAGRSPPRGPSTCPPRCGARRRGDPRRRGRHAQRLPLAGARRPPAAARRARRLPRATTSSGRSSTCPTSPPTTSGIPDAVLPRHRPAVRLRPLAPAGGAGRQRGRGRGLGRRRGRAPPTTRPGRASTRSPPTCPARWAGRPSRRRDPTTGCPR